MRLGEAFATPAMQDKSRQTVSAHTRRVATRDPHDTEPFFDIEIMRNHPDFLRSPENIFDPDPRSASFDVLGANGFRPKTLQDQYEAVAEITLHGGVPREIVVKFETAKNLNLFSWFVYRFHTAARSHVYECLELALRTRFKGELLEREEKRRLSRYEEQLKKNPKRSVQPPQPIDPAKFRPGLRELLEYAIEMNALKNENFSVWQLRTKGRARLRRDLEAIKTMKELGLAELEIDDAQIEISDADRAHDYLGEVVQTVPLLRNHYAHGTSSLDNQSLAALRLAAEIINQIFPEPAGGER